MKLFCHILWLINMITCVHRLQSFVSWFVQRIDCKKAFLKNTWGIIFDPVQRLFKINCHVTSNRPKRHFWSTFKLFDLDQMLNFEQIEITWSLIVQNFAFDPVRTIWKWTKSGISNKLRHHLFRKAIWVDQKRNWLHVSHHVIHTTTSSIFFTGSKVTPRSLWTKIEITSKNGFLSNLWKTQLSNPFLLTWIFQGTRPGSFDGLVGELNQ